MENQDIIIELLNDLIIINNDRIEGYQKAAKEASALALKGLFEAMSRDSRVYASELAIQVAQLGGKVPTTTSTAGDIYRVWMSIKSTLTAHDRKALLTSCEEGEEVALAAYKNAIDSDIELTPTIRQLLIHQKNKLEEGKEAIVKLRDTVYA